MDILFAQYNSAAGHDIAGSLVASLWSASVSASRNLFSPCLEKISEMGIPNFDMTISSVSNSLSLARRRKQTPTDDFPAPIMPTRTIDRPWRFIGAISH